MSTESHYGGSGKYLPCHQPGSVDLVRERDLALAQNAYIKAGSYMRAQAASFGRPAEYTTGTYHMLKDIFQGLRKSCGCLTPKQRAVCMRILGLKELPAIRDGALAQALPKKPPGRVQEPAETAYVKCVDR